MSDTETPFADQVERDLAELTATARVVWARLSEIWRSGQRG